MAEVAKKGYFLLQNWSPGHPQSHAPSAGLGAGGHAGILGVYGSGRGKLAVLEAGLKVKADVKLPLQRRRAAAKIAVKQLGFAASPGTWLRWLLKML